VLKGKLAVGYEIERVEEEPKFIEVKGRKSIIADLTTVYTYPIDITGLSQNLRFEVPIDEEKSEIKVEGERKMVRVDIKVRERIIEKTFTDVPIRVEDLKQATQAIIMPDKANLVVKGPEAILRNLKKDEGIKIFLDGKMLNPNRVVKRKAQVVLPKGVILLKLDPEWFKIRVEVNKA